jgi:hypothetical protein
MTDDSVIPVPVSSKGSRLFSSKMCAIVQNGRAYLCVAIFRATHYCPECDSRKFGGRHVIEELSTKSSLHS